MKICYIILSHKSPELLSRLIERLSTPDVSFVIHIDNKVKIQSFKERLSNFSHQIFYSARVNSDWGDISLVKATLNCIEEIFKNKIQFEYAIMMSGQDYPIKSNKYLHDFFLNSDGNLYMEIFNEEKHTKHWQSNVFNERLRFYFKLFNNSWFALNDNNVLLKQNNDNKDIWEPTNEVSINDLFQRKQISFPRTIPDCKYKIDGQLQFIKMLAWGGSQWWAFPKEVISFLKQFIYNNPQYLDFHEQTYILDEIFFQTIIMNHPQFSKRVINNRLRFIDWSREPKPMTFNDDYLNLFKDLCENHPFCLFARKFDLPESEKLLNQIDQYLDLQESLDNISYHVFQYSILKENSVVEVRNSTRMIYNPLRFDLLVKYIFAKSVIDKKNTKWINELYIQHIKYFNNFSEDNFPKKTTGNHFISSFKKLIKEYEKSDIPYGLRTIPIDKTYCPLDGAHRLAVLAAKGINVNTVQLEKKYPLTHFAFNYEFFIKKGMPFEYADFIALEYARINPDSFLLCLFPSCQSLWDEIDVLIKKNRNVFYEKSIVLSDIGKLNFIINLYRNEPWLGSTENSYEGANYKMNECFKTGNEVKIYLLHNEKLEDVNKLKQEIRDLCKIGNHSVHSTDKRDTTFELATIAFNSNTISFINCFNPYNSFQNFNQQFEFYKKYIRNNNLNSNLFCIEGSAILAACNLRDCYDLDFLYDGKDYHLPQTPNKVDCHNNYFYEGMKYDKIFKISIDEIISNPKYYFYYEGFKIMSPSLIKQFKMYRNEPKDIKDVELINQYLNLVQLTNIKIIKTTIRDYKWYPMFDSILREKVDSGKFPKIYLNARLQITQEIKDKYKEWLKIMNISNEENDYDNCFYTFELFQKLDISFEGVYFSFIECLIKQIHNERKYDFCIFLRMCLTTFVKYNHVKKNEDIALFKEVILNLNF